MTIAPRHFFVIEVCHLHFVLDFCRFVLTPLFIFKKLDIIKFMCSTGWEPASQQFPDMLMEIYDIITRKT